MKSCFKTETLNILKINFNWQNSLKRNGSLGHKYIHYINNSHIDVQTVRSIT